MDRFDRDQLTVWYAVVAGVALIGAGLLGFIDNPIVGEPANDPIFHTGVAHNIVHVATGALALYIAFGLQGSARANGLIAFGLLYGVVLLATLLSPDLFGILEHPVNVADHVLHVILAGGSLVVGWLGRSETLPEVVD